MKTKQKILEALDCALDEISEERLLEILMDAYKAKKDRISQLEGENCHEREVMHHERQKMHEEYRRMRDDPLYCASGRYFFLVNHHKISVYIQGTKIEAFERVGQTDYAAEQLPPAEWHSASHK